MPMIETLAGAEADEYRERVLDVWSRTFGPVEDPGAWRDSPWDRHRTRPGYRLAVAREGETLLGFAWGYTGERGQYWSDHVVKEVGSAVSGWVGGHFEFVELAVVPEARGEGIGGMLHDVLLADLPHTRALLETSDRADGPAVRLYASRGWTSLATHGAGRQVMGLALPGRAAPPVTPPPRRPRP